MLRRLAIAAALVAAACGSSGTHIIKTPATISHVTLTAPAISGPRRGPVILRWGLADPDGTVTDVRLERSTRAGWVPATTMTLARSASSVLAIWDSFADLATDGAVKVRLVAVEPKVETPSEVTLDIWDDPETDRVILTGHDLIDLAGGGAVAEGVFVSALSWNGLTHALTGDPVSVTVGKGPKNLRASPNGRSSLVILDKDGTVDVIGTPLTANASTVQRIATLAPPATITDAHWSPDGRYVYAITYAEGDLPASIWRWEPTEDLSSFGDATNLGPLPGPPTSFDIEAKTGRLLVSCGAGSPTGIAKLTVHSPDGVELARLTKDIGVHQVKIHHDGGLALLVPDFFGEDIHRIRFTDSTIDEEGDPLTTVRAPWEIVFHPQSTAASGAALVSNQDKNTVTPLLLAATSETSGTPVGSVPLASEMDLIERGSQLGTVFVTAVTAVYRVELAADGTTVNRGAIYDFGMNTEDIISGVAVQR